MMRRRCVLTAEQPCVSERVDLLFFGAVDRLQDDGIGAAGGQSVDGVATALHVSGDCQACLLYTSDAADD